MECPCKPCLRVCGPAVQFRRDQMDPQAVLGKVTSKKMHYNIELLSKKITSCITFYSK